MVLPEKLQALIEELSLTDEDTRAEILIELADEFEPVTADIATTPYPEENRVPGCESEVFMFARARGDGSYDFHYAIENPQGISAMAMASIIQQTLSGLPADEIKSIPVDIAYQIFGRTLSMGKGQGLMGMVSMLKSVVG
ncbi:hypothetical protein EBR25_01755 [bacterium]|jgi:cysteine desulfuration protein SufE|nr:hypothetical protein [bacterium]